MIVLILRNIIRKHVRWPWLCTALPQAAVARAQHSAGQRLVCEVFKAHGAGLVV